MTGGVRIGWLGIIDADSTEGSRVVFETLKEIMVEVLCIPPERITPDTTREDLGLDSLSLVELAMVLEKKHGLTISDDELQDAETVSDIVALMGKSRASTS
jgi:acyl carrier protein